MEKNGFFVVLEGCDGSGKGVVKSGLERHLRQKVAIYSLEMGIQVFFMRQPSKEARIEINKVDPCNWLRVLYLFMKDREEQYNNFLRGYLSKKNVVVMDRYYHSSCVYQGMMASMSPVEILKAHGPWIVRPDLTLILLVDHNELERRLMNREKTMEKLEGDRNIRVEIQRRYADLCRGEYPEFNECVFINGTGTPTQVLEQCIIEVDKAFQGWIDQ